VVHTAIYTVVIVAVDAVPHPVLSANRAAAVIASGASAVTTVIIRTVAEPHVVICTADDLGIEKVG
jgi:hypothetical protein